MFQTFWMGGDPFSRQQSAGPVLIDALPGDGVFLKSFLLKMTDTIPIVWAT